MENRAQGLLWRHVALAAVPLAVASSGCSAPQRRLTIDDIRFVIRAYVGNLDECYEASLPNNPWLAGQIDVRFVINADGTVLNVDVSRTNIQDQSLLTCVAARFDRIVFPDPGRKVPIIYPITFPPPGWGLPSDSEGLPKGYVSL